MICNSTQYFSGDQIEKNKMGGACSTQGGDGRCIQDFGRKPKGKTTLGRPSYRWEDNVKMDIQEVGCGGMEWIDVAQDGYR